MQPADPAARTTSSSGKKRGPAGPRVLAEPGAAQNFIGMVVASPVTGSITEA